MTVDLSGGGFSLRFFSTPALLAQPCTPHRFLASITYRAVTLASRLWADKPWSLHAGNPVVGYTSNDRAVLVLAGLASPEFILAFVRARRPF